MLKYQRKHYSQEKLNNNEKRHENLNNFTYNKRETLTIEKKSKYANVVHRNYTKSFEHWLVDAPPTKTKIKKQRHEWIQQRKNN